MSKSHEMDQLIDDLYVVPAGKIEPVGQALRPTADKPQLSIAQSCQFGKARLRGYDLVVNSYNDLRCINPVVNDWKIWFGGRISGYSINNL